MPDTAARNETDTAVAGGARKLRRLRHLRHDTAAGDHARYWRSTRRLAIVAVVLWSLIALALPLAYEQLDAVSVLDIPLGYYFGAQGGLILIAILMLLAARRQNRLDSAHRADFHGHEFNHRAGGSVAVDAAIEHPRGGR